MKAAPGPKGCTGQRQGQASGGCPQGWRVAAVCSVLCAVALLGLPSASAAVRIDGVAAPADPLRPLDSGRPLVVQWRDECTDLVARARNLPPTEVLVDWSFLADPGIVVEGTLEEPVDISRCLGQAGPFVHNSTFMVGVKPDAPGLRDLPGRVQLSLPPGAPGPRNASATFSVQAHPHPLLSSVFPPALQKGHGTVPVNLTLRNLGNVPLETTMRVRTVGDPSQATPTVQGDLTPFRIAAPRDDPTASSRALQLELRIAPGAWRTVQVWLDFNATAVGRPDLRTGTSGFLLIENDAPPEVEQSPGPGAWLPLALLGAAWAQARRRELPVAWRAPQGAPPGGPQR